ncbi:DUF4760 domain-containing protein [Psychromonas sp. L1A2]|uniref:DUF4760 domain-containing protein n=1 Tax=Psychromonas sp. L1A2 TaxID=2686356 RepID=UPI00135A6666|nr:DUF4760 domain-containing protein [Psychromonas sp. L1A2]
MINSWITNNVDIISTAVSILSLLSLFLIYKQLKDTKTWNKLHFTYTFFPDSKEFEELEIFLDDRLNFWQRDSALSDLEVKALLGKENLNETEKNQLYEKFNKNINKDDCAKELIDAGRKLKIYLNELEYYCAAVSSGVIDSESAKNIYSYKFKRAYEKALPWIEEVRKMKNETSIYIEITKILNNWHPSPAGQKNKY